MARALQFLAIVGFVHALVGAERTGHAHVGGVAEDVGGLGQREARGRRQQVGTAGAEAEYRQRAARLAETVGVDGGFGDRDREGLRRLAVVVEGDCRARVDRAGRERGIEQGGGASPAGSASLATKRSGMPSSRAARASATSRMHWRGATSAASASGERSAAASASSIRRASGSPPAS